MKNLKQLQEHLHHQEGGNSAYYMGYKEAIEGILEDIQIINLYSRDDIEEYIENLLKK